MKITAYVTDIRAREDYGKCRREACWRRTFPVPVILNRFETAFRVLLREIGFGIRRGR